ncbi:MAG: ATP-dependent DNA helicase [Lachnospiraceae bacterium]|nr:ATP-dependent DNA helicase [Lachnospiraceae bacterium]
MSKKNDEQTRPVLHISVRNLVEFLLRSGDIDDRVGSRDPYKSMQAGSRIHRKIQRSMGSDYHAEVPLSIIQSFEDYDLMIEGRVDGIFMKKLPPADPADRIEADSQKINSLDDDTDSDSRSPSDASVDEPSVTTVVETPDEELDEIPCGIDEIKGVYLDLDALDEPIPVHLAQAKVYAYIIGFTNHLSSVFVQMTYCNLDTEEVRRFSQDIPFDDLAAWFSDLVRQYKRWADFQIHWKALSTQSIHAIDFPYKYRPGQRHLAGSVYHTILEHKLLFIQAPTGSGKTLASLFPAIKAVGEGLADRIFYLTSKSVTKKVAIDTIDLLSQNGYRGKTVELTAKDRICPLEERSCNPDDCPYAKGHFDRVNDAVYVFLTGSDLFTRDRILDFAKERRVCPFEFSLDLSSWCDNIICDYNYVFDPTAYLKRFFGEGERANAVFLIDEAHNLVDRSRNMYSAALVKEDVLHIKKILKTRAKKVATQLDRVNRAMLEWKRDCTNLLILPEIDAFTFKCMNLASEMEKFLEKRIPFPERDEVVEFYFNLRNFLDRTEEMDERYRIYCDYGSDGSFRVHLFCMDPSRQLQERLDKSNGAVFFSATFLPVRYYKNLLCTEETPYAVYAETVFSPDQFRVCIGTDVTTRYRERGADIYERYARYLLAMVQAHPGNYMAFFPSYSFLENVYQAFLFHCPSGLLTLAQTSGMGDAERSEFLSNFEEDHSQGLLGFCVMGGLFSEGIDLTSDRLIGAAIVGTGLPQVNIEQNLLKDYFDQAEETKNEGFSYAYVYPGMAKVLQAAGRVIRTEEDRGVILLLDQRFLWSDYKKILPREWGELKTCTVDTVGDLLSDFWKKI